MKISGVICGAIGLMSLCVNSHGAETHVTDDSTKTNDLNLNSIIQLLSQPQVQQVLNKILDVVDEAMRDAEKDNNAQQYSTTLIESSTAETPISTTPLSVTKSQIYQTPSVIPDQDLIYPVETVINQGPDIGSSLPIAALAVGESERSENSTDVSCANRSKSTINKSTPFTRNNSNKLNNNIIFITTFIAVSLMFL